MRAAVRQLAEKGLDARHELGQRILQVHRESGATYGSPRIHRELMAKGVQCAENTVAKLMRNAGIRSKAQKRFKLTTTDSRHSQPIADNTLNREFQVNEPDKIWAADIIYIPTAKGWLYLAVVMDLCTRRVVGWATADHRKAELATSALRMALEHRRPSQGVLHHSDRGVQYASEQYRQLLAMHRLEASMSGVGNCYDNAVVESFFSTLKRELTHHTTYNTHEEAQQSLFEYIEVFYNRRRLHSTLGYRSPAEVENSVP
jgi:transposase InsO family protein